MPFDEQAPFHGPDGDPNHKQVSAAQARFGNGFIDVAGGGDGDPPTKFFTHETFLKIADIDGIDFDALVAQNVETYPFGGAGVALVGLSSLAFNVVEFKTNVLTWLRAGVAPSGGPLEVNFEYKGDDVLNTPLSIASGAPAGQVVFSVDFALNTFDPSSSLDFYRPLRCRVLNANGAAAVEAGIVVQRYIPAP